MFQFGAVINNALVNTCKKSKWNMLSFLLGKYLGPSGWIDPGACRFGSWRGSYSGLADLHLFMCPHVVDREEAPVSLLSLIRALIPSCGSTLVTSSNSNYLLRASLPHPPGS